VFDLFGKVVGLKFWNNVRKVGRVLCVIVVVVDDDDDEKEN
jgi:hypothetical protein